MLVLFTNRQFFVGWYSKPSVHLWSKLTLLSCIMQTPLKSPHELHLEGKKQNSSFQKEIFFHAVNSVTHFPSPHCLFRITIQEKINGHWTMPMRRTVCKARWISRPSSAEAPVSSPPFNVTELCFVPLNPKRGYNSVSYVPQQTRTRQKFLIWIFFTKNANVSLIH